ncbi:MAG: DUF2156 domain-containing protein [Oscillospiraceae bacterium]|nr:DUF2156 domain-containing protein [Oscillospiraceae bacterium]
MKSDDYAVCAPVMESEGFMCTESGFPTLYMWSDFYNTEICIKDGTVYFRTGHGDDVAYTFPYGGNLKSALLEIYEEEKANGRKPRFLSLTRRMRERIETLFPGEFVYTEKRSSFDYIYSRKALATLSGKNYHQKRNHVNKFTKRYSGRFEYSAMVKADIPEVLKFQKKWMELASEKQGIESLRYETHACEELLSHFSEFSLRGGILRLDGEICAYCVGAKISDDTVDVMIEKADFRLDGAYQVINKLFCENECKDVSYINREEDMGIEGLRRAKLSYYPEFMLEKYGALWEK